MYLLIFFFNDPATTDIYTLSLHDALPIYRGHELGVALGIDNVDARAEHSNGGGGARQTAAMRRCVDADREPRQDRKSTRLNSSHRTISYAVFCLKKKKKKKCLSKENQTRQ